jgi:hypothetical protein
VDSLGYGVTSAPIFWRRHDRHSPSLESQPPLGASAWRVLPAALRASTLFDAKLEARLAMWPIMEFLCRRHLQFNTTDSTHEALRMVRFSVPFQLSDCRAGDCLLAVLTGVCIYAAVFLAVAATVVCDGDRDALAA